MSTPKEKLEEQLKQLAAEAERKKIQAAALLSEKPSTAALEDVSKKTIGMDEQTDEIFIKPKPGAYNQDWKAVVDAYKQEFKKSPDKNGALVFDSPQEATEFFKNRAAAGNKFYATKYVDGKPMDHHMFSCGDGQLYEGSSAEIKLQLEAAVKKDPTNKLTQEGLASFTREMLEPVADSAAKRTQDMRGQIQEARDLAAAEIPAEPAPSNAIPKPK